MQVDTIKIKAENAKGYRLINASDFDANSHKPYDADARQAVKRNAADAEASEKLAAERKAQANFGQVDGNAIEAGGKNPSGTYSEPTPTDIRYPDKDTTEFENNHGAFVGKSAAGLREELDMVNAPGGLEPDPSFQPGEPGAVTEAAQPEAAPKASAKK